MRRFIVADIQSVRIAYGQALAEYGAQNTDVVALDADVSSSTQSHYFAARHPSRFFNVGIAEAGMVDVAVGLALGGKIPFVNTFAFLLALRAAEQIRTCVAYSQVPVKLVGHYGGLSDSFDGPTHHAISDVATIRAMPGMAVVVPADGPTAQAAVKTTAEYPGPVYLRLNRNEVPNVYGPKGMLAELGNADTSAEITIGKGKTLVDGEDVTIVACGVMVARALEAAKALKAEGVSARVLDFASVKPLDIELLEKAARETGAIVSAEEHSTVGGLGGAVAEALSGAVPVPVVRVGIADRFAETGPYDKLLERYGMSVLDVVRAAKKAISLKR